MNLQQLKDCELLSQIKTFVQSERDLLVNILHHLREIERRRLFSDLGYNSLFDYALNELKYSEGQASRRIQAMRLLKELPQVETKIASGELSLTNVQQAQSFFRDVEAADPRRIVTSAEKLEVLGRLENKSTRDGQKELLKINPIEALPKEKERVVTETASEVRFIMSDALKAKLEEVRSLLGTRGAAMTYAALFDVMSDYSLSALKAKHFGKKRSQNVASVSAAAAAKIESETVESDDVPKIQTALAAPVVNSSENPRFISQALKHQVWQRDKGICTNCRSQKNLNYDHVTPVALGGEASLENLRLLCFHCNQRASVKIFGMR